MDKELTKQQKAIVEEKSGRFVVRACPGSGKTYTVAARLARLIKKWDEAHAGIAALSFTNVAWKEIEQYLVQEFDVPVPNYPHFLGTIDSFLNTYVFLPFGHTVMGCEGRPTLSGPPYDNVEPTEVDTWLHWKWGICQRKQCKLNAISYDIDGQLSCFNGRAYFKNCGKNHKRCRDLKQIFNSSGHATQLDANYYSMKLLVDNELLASALARRFPVLIVDEAQDSSAIQMRIIDLLASAGLEEIILVGDPDQAIFEWRTAEPSNFTAKYNEWENNSEELDKNWRSTKSICVFASKLSELTMEHADIDLPDPGPEPMIIPYTSDDLDSTVIAFETECKDSAEPLEDIAILCRSRSRIPEITGAGRKKDQRPLPWRGGDTLTRDLVYAAHLRDKGEWLAGFRITERSLAKLQTGKSRVTQENLRALHGSTGFSEWRARAYRVLRLLPDTLRTPLGQWVNEASSKLQSIGIPQDRIQIKTGKHKEYYGQLSITQLLGGGGVAETPSGIPCGTVHAFKGQTLDAVLLVVGKKGGNYAYKTVLGSSLEENEELRIIYVAITRAKMLLWIAVPEEDHVLWYERFGEAVDWNSGDITPIPITRSSMKSLGENGVREKVESHLDF